MASNNISNKTVLYSYYVGGTLISVYNDGTETASYVDPGAVIKTITGNQSQTIYDTVDGKAGSAGTTTNTIINANNAGDTIDGRKASGDDSYFGGNGKDVLWAGSGNVYLDGNNGSDILHGGAGTTTLVGGNGGDVLYGGTGIDTFLYRNAADSSYAAGGPAPVSSPNGWDIIQNFEHGKDKIDFTVLEDTQVGAGGTTQLTGAGPNHLVWRGAYGTDGSAGQANSLLAHSVWTETVDGNGNTHFLYVDTTGDGKADIKIQIDNAALGDLNGVTDNHAPVITSGTSGSEQESTAVANVVYQTAANDPDGDTIHYTLTGDDAALFNISATGAVTFKASPDFEAPADKNHDNAYQITVHASDGFKEATQDVTINVTDVNDNAPVITTAASQSVNENQAFSVALTSTDVDTVGTNPATFTIAGGADQALFSIDASGHLVMAAQDYESPADADHNNTYVVQVRANDGANTTDETITVTVGDVNDNAPVITTAASQSVNENQAFSVALTSTDVDTVGTNPATFTITGGADQALFSIDATGHLVMAAQDYESPADADHNNTYVVQVRANDGANTTDETITVTVGDVNDNAPVITTAASQSVNENQAFSVALTSTDVDTVGTNPATFTIAGGADQALFSIDASGHLVMAAKDYESPADADHNNTYVVQVRANDGANTTDETITVTVGDVNDNAPVITTAASQSVNENQAFSVALTSTDVDTVGTNPATFTITGGADQALFSIDATGHLVMAAQDYESPADADHNNTYVVQVTANDGANTTDETITVTVGDVNDNAPVITTAASQSVNENQAFSVALTSTDVDTVGTNPATFTITGGADQALFSIDATGHLVMAAKDYESPADADHNNTYVVQVRANDGANTTDETITVTVGDVNDNAPVITTAASQSVNENQAFSVALTSTDVDTVGTNPATFTIAGGADQALFSIDASGHLVMAAKDYESPADADHNNTYVVQVRANDGANTTDETITVTVGDVNDNAPVITTAASQSVNENQAFSVALTSTDVDTVGTNPATFTITGGADQALFSIDATGHLVMAAQDYESPADADHNNTYVVQVTANDGANTTDETITVVVNNVNEAPTAPVDSDNAANSVNAHASNGTAVGLTAHSTDPDAGDSVTYHITGGTGGSLFAVDATTGVVSVANSANLDAGSYTLLIDAVDSHGLASTSSSFTINALQTDQGGPTGINFVLSQTGILAGDNTSNGAQLNAGLDLGAFVATGDPDQIDTFHYQLSGTNAGLFSINANTGELSVGGANIAQQAAAYSFTVTATDQANHATSTDVSVWVVGPGGDTVNGGSGIDIEFGQNGADTLNGAGGSDALLGGPQADKLYGGLGGDQLVGGDGKDVFQYKAVSDSDATHGIDTVYNYSVSGSSLDQFDFSAIAGLNDHTQAVSVVTATSAPTTLAAHTIDIVTIGSDTFVYANAGNGPETVSTGTDIMQIHIAGVTGVTASDFILH
ncbi:VCBS domain-containing protein [Bradyrhizobium sp. CB1650]|uniref:VCBS domain-containing protein n=1 Tax=Bradyrhizobium sp. CB1650 TaxID=3039153 RepID=UPI0024348A55|nr:VCBS domain-containing protein [Bradyrhizobium sp. CB1650]WGD49495.1 VCBS domain-containing protein [Bradyrhizobium sp. CB1650]